MLLCVVRIFMKQTLCSGQLDTEAKKLFRNLSQNETKSPNGHGVLKTLSHLNSPAFSRDFFCKFSFIYTQIFLEYFVKMQIDKNKNALSRKILPNCWQTMASWIDYQSEI